MVFEITQRVAAQLVQNILNDLKEHNVYPSNLYFRFNDSHLFIWAVIRDNDFVTGAVLKNSQSRLNAKQAIHGFQIETYVLERKNLEKVPDGYKEVLLNY